MKSVKTMAVAATMLVWFGLTGGVLLEQTRAARSTQPALERFIQEFADKLSRDPELLRALAESGAATDPCATEVAEVAFAQTALEIAQDDLTEAELALQMCDELNP